MTQPTQTCLNCGNPHTPFERGGFLVPLCSECESQMVQQGLLGTVQGSAVAPPAGAVQDSRFRPLSSLPPSQRLPSRKNPAVASQQPAPTPPPTLGQLPVRSQTSPNGQVNQQPRALPGVPALRPQKLPQISQDRKIGFNCPACLAILVIKQPDNYDWTAAPCPSCQTVILPPRIVPPSPFQIANSHSSSQPLPQGRSSQPMQIPQSRPTDARDQPPSRGSHIPTRPRDLVGLNS